MKRIKSIQLPLINWQDSVETLRASWQQFLSVRQKANIPQVLLVTGASSDDLFHLAYAMATSYFCLTNNACFRCEACQNASHQLLPDLFVIETEDTHLKVEAASSIEEFLLSQPESPGLGKAPKRICIIKEADKLTLSAVNRLLKILEEPPEHAQIILTSPQRRMLLPTLLSRCVIWRANALSDSASTLDINTALKAEEENAILQLLGASGSADETLLAAEKLAKDLDMGLKDFLLKAELVLNRYYRNKVHAHLAGVFPGLMERRKAIRLLKDFVIRKKIALNVQLSLESLK